MEILILLLLIVFNGLLAMSEISIVSARKARLQQWSNDGNRQAAAALALAESPLVFLSTMQIGITFSAILSGAFGEAAVSRRVESWLTGIAWLAPHRDAVAFGLVVVTVTYLSLLGELVPKRVALHHAERLACLVAGPMRFAAIVAAPAVRFVSFSCTTVLRLLRVQASDEPPVTEDELHVIIGQAAEAGVFTEAEEDLLKSAVRLGDRQVETLMTPRTEVVWLDLDDSPEELAQTVVETDHSWFPVARGSLDELVGVLSARTVLAQCLPGEAPAWSAATEKPLIAPEGTPSMRLFDQFKTERTHLAMVIDEYGGVAGLVTLVDLLEALLGDLPRGDEPDDGLVVRCEDGSWLVDGLTPVAEFRERFELDELPHEGEYVTIAGFVLHQLERLAAVGDAFEWEGWRFEVVAMDGRRIDRLRLQPPAGSDHDG